MINYLSVSSPYDGKVLEELELSGPIAIEKALSEAFKLYRNRSSWLPLYRRIEILEKFLELLKEQQTELAAQATMEGGKPLSDSLVEVARGIDGVKITLESIRADTGSSIPMGGTSASVGRIAFTQKEPIGVVVAVSAFNHPLNLIIHQVIPAVATGCPVIVKPSQDTPLSCRSVVDLLNKAGLPKFWCQMIIPAETKLTEALVTDPRVAFLSFIGSSRVGWSLRSKIAPGTRCALEHGGAAPVFIEKDADLDLASTSLVKGGFYHAGQVCVSTQRIFVQRDVLEEFSNLLVRKAQGLIVGDPLKMQTEVGPLIRNTEVQRIDEWVTEATEFGQLLCGGIKLENNGYAPTVVMNPDTQAKLSQNEVFGPVICVYEYDDLDNAIAQANSLPFAFQAAVFTQNIEMAISIYRQLDASAVMLNDHTAFRVDGMPFAGLRQSGLGVGGIPHTIADMQIDKMLVINGEAMMPFNKI